MQVNLLRNLTVCCSLALVSTVSADDPAEDVRNAEYRAYATAHAGDASAGEKVFNENRKAVCADCHRITGMEKSGPNLDGIGEKYSRDELITHLLEPSATIMPGYQQASVLMNDGRVFVGRVERRNQLIVRLMDAKGKRNNLKVPQVEQVQYSDVSLMPKGIATGLSIQEFADLIAYLGSLRFGVKDGLAAGGTKVPIPRLARSVEFDPIHPPEIVFENPVWCEAFPGRPGELAVVEHQNAKVWRYVRDGKRSRKELFVDLGSQIHINGDQGLTSIAFHPKFQNNGRYFLEHEVHEDGIVKTTVVERRAAANGLTDSGQPSIRYLQVRQPAGNHNGGCIAFGNDGMLYAAFGDGGPQKDPEGYSQNPREFLGSMLRINVDRRNKDRPYSIPNDNPFLDQHARDPAIRAETFAIGFREPWRFSFDPLTGDLYVGDVGQNEYEEVCLVRAGENHGWNVREAFAPFSDQYRREGERYVEPLFAYQHGLGFSVTGGHVYRGDPESSFYGVYIFGDFNTHRVWGLKQSGGKLLEVREIGTAPGGIASFGVDDRGEILLVTYSGEIYHVDLSSSRFE